MRRDKKSVLVAEASDHYKILEQIFHLLANKCVLNFYIIKPTRYNYHEMFPSAKKEFVKEEKFRGVFFFFGLLLRGWKYDFVNISTGPEGSHYTDIVRILGFYLCCILYRRKIILTVRNIAPYLQSTPGLFSWLRARAIRHLNRFTFETETMKDEFCKHARRSGAHYAVSYDRYPDVLTTIAGGAVVERDKGLIRIGLLGSVTEERRDYSLICDALSEVTHEERSRIEFVIMGECPGGPSNHIIKRFDGLAKVDCTSGILSELQFAMRGKSCEVLLAPLSRKSAYGTLKGSGAIGDAVYLKRRMIIPDFVDPMREFESFCIYYSDASELATHLSRIVRDYEHGVSDEVFAKFETHSVYRSLVADLNLCPVR